MLKTIIVTPSVPDYIVHPFPILGPAILKTFLDSRGYTIDLVDLAVRVRYLNRFPLRKIFNLEIFQNRERIINFLENGKDSCIENEIEKLIRLGNLEYYDVVGFSLSDEANITVSLCIAKVLKEKYDTKIVFGGPIISRSDYTALLYFDFLDFLIAGDGEEPFLRILQYFDTGVIENFEGILYRKNGKLHVAKPSVFPIEDKPIPTFNVDDLFFFKKLSMVGLSVIPYLLTRGCRFKCVFCAEYRDVSFEYTPLEKVISDIKFLLKNYSVDSICFAEANVCNDPLYIKKLSERIIEEGLNFSWGGMSTLPGLDENIIEVMAKAGCKYIICGVENVSEHTANSMNMRKVGNLREFKETLKLLHKHGIKVHNFYIVEFPYETLEDFKQNVDFIKENAKYITSAEVTRFALLENSPLFLSPHTFKITIRNRRNKKYGFFDRDWEFDEINGLKWEQKYKKSELKVRLLNRVIYKQIFFKSLFKSIFKHPLYIAKKKVLYRYITFDEYFL